MRYPTLEDWAQARDNDQHSKVRELLPRLDWHSLWEQEDEEEWLLYPLIPARRLIALFSAAKVGKSLLMLEIAAALSTGKKVLGHDPGRRVRVLYVDFENDPRGDVRTRLQDMGYGPADLDRLDYLSFPSLPYLDSEMGAASLLAAVEAYGPELVVIDTISRAVKGEENDNDTWLNLYKHTGLTLKKAKVAMIRLDHTGKDETKGQRGGSAKSGDVDAIWKLSTEVKDERYLLTCLDARFSLDDKELTLLRHDWPLHHTLQDSKPVDGREAKILHVIDLANRDSVPAEGRDKLMAWAVKRGLQYGKSIYQEATKRRKLRANLVFKPVDNSSKNLPPNLPRAIFSEPAPEPAPNLPPTSNGQDRFPLSDLPPTPGGSNGAGPTPEPAPGGGSIYKTAAGAGEGPKPGNEPCEECGWDRFHKAACSHNPYKREEVD